jgi:hypothetical protein
MMPNTVVVMLAWWEVLYTGYIDIQVGFIHYSQGEEDESASRKDYDASSLLSTSRSILDPVDETPVGSHIDPELMLDADSENGFVLSPSHT